MFNVAIFKMKDITKNLIAILIIILIIIIKYQKKHNK